MEFRKNQAIYLQITDLICSNIVARTWPEGEKISSVREMAASIEVNPNTVMRAYAMLQEDKILFNKRGIGFFVNKGAIKAIITKQKKDFLKEDLPEIFKKMEMLDIGYEELENLYKKFRKQ